MISYFGYIFIIFALIANFINLFLTKLSINKDSKNLDKVFLFITRLSFIFILISFCCLVFAYVKSDFTNLNVFLNSHSEKPLIYRVSGTWGNHEGSLLLWVLIMSFYNFIFSFEKNINKLTKNWVIFFQSLMTISFIFFMIFTSNPFIINDKFYSEGLGLNPILQDPALAIHPPLLYMGYVGFSLVLSLSISGLLTKSIERDWIEVTKKYAIFCWSMLTLGIAVGSFWAYYELGWGGWWFWDPVENASLMPWLSGLALIHSLIILNHEEQLKRWIIFLSILCFSLSLLGTFLVRSGVLMSVHAFANDSSRGIFILMIFLIITGFSFLIFLIKIPESNIERKFIFLNKSGILIINNIIMIIACFTVLLGTIYPLIIESITDKRISVGAPYFNSTVLPILLPGLMLMAIGPIISWKKNIKINSSYKNIFIIIILSLFIIYILSNINPWGIIGVGIGIWIITASFVGIIKKIRILKNKSIYKILISCNSLIAHLGVGILIIGATSSSIWDEDFTENINVGDTIKIQDYKLEFDDLIQTKKDNYNTLIARFIIKKEENKIGIINAEKRYYPVPKIITTEAGILHQFWQDIYVVIGDNNNNGWIIKVYINPLVSFIWLGVLIIVFGSLLSWKKN